jgi:hypothetical protein
MGLAGYAVFANRNPPVVNPEPATDPKGWQQLLVNEPTKRLWPRADTQFAHDPKAQTLFLHSRTPALVRLGETNTAGYKLQIGVKQVQWGRVGVYFGGQQEGQKYVFQFVQLSHLRLGKVRSSVCGESAESTT